MRLNAFTPKALRQQCTGLKTPAPQQIHTFSAHREAMFLQNAVFVPETQIYHNSTEAFFEWQCALNVTKEIVRR